MPQEDIRGHQPEECRISGRLLGRVADALEAQVDEILVAYKTRLRAMNSPLIAEVDTHGELEEQARAVLEDVARDLRGREELFEERRGEDLLSAAIGISRARNRVHPSESLRAVIALSEATLSVLAHNLPPSPVLRSEATAVALSVQKSILERVARASVSYVNHLLAELYRAHAEERQRIGRELHDRVAHSIMVVFRNLELYEIYDTQDPSKAQEKFELAKRTAQEALKATRDLSKELRESSAEEGLEIALSKHLRLIAPPDLDARISTKGDESLIPSEVRDELFLILREAINNAVAHSRARTVKIEINTSRHRVHAVVEDDGSGFQPDEVSSSGGTGIPSMRERASILGGTFDLTSGSGNGTRISLLVPLPRSEVR